MADQAERFRYSLLQPTCCRGGVRQRHNDRAVCHIGSQEKERKPLCRGQCESLQERGMAGPCQHVWVVGLDMLQQEVGLVLRKLEAASGAGPESTGPASRLGIGAQGLALDQAEHFCQACKIRYRSVPSIFQGQWQSGSAQIFSCRDTTGSRWLSHQDMA